WGFVVGFRLAVAGRRAAGAGGAMLAFLHLPLVEGGGGAAPLRDALGRHDDPAVGPAVALHLLHLSGRPGRVAAVAERGVDGIEARSRAALRTVPIEGNAESEHLPRGGQPTRRRDALGRDVVQSAQLAVGSPPAQVPNLKGDLPERLLTHLRRSRRYCP